MHAFPIAAIPEGDNAPCEIQPTALAVLSDSLSPPGAKLLLRAAKMFSGLSQLRCVLQLCCAELSLSHFEMYGLPYLPSSA